MADLRYWDGTQWVSLAVDTGAVTGTIIADMELDTGSLSGGGNISSNNGITSMRMDENLEGLWRATLPHFQRNYQGGDVTMRLVVTSTFSGDVAENIILELSVLPLKAGVTLAADYTLVDTLNLDWSAYLFDTIVTLDLTIPAVQVDTSAEVYAFRLRRDGVTDTFPHALDIHAAYLSWTGKGI